MILQCHLTDVIKLEGQAKRNLYKATRDVAFEFRTSCFISFELIRVIRWNCGARKFSREEAEDCCHEKGIEYSEDEK